MFAELSRETIQSTWFQTDKIIRLEMKFFKDIELIIRKMGEGYGFKELIGVELWKGRWMILVYDTVSCTSIIEDQVSLIFYDTGVWWVLDLAGY